MRIKLQNKYRQEGWIDREEKRLRKLWLDGDNEKREEKFKEQPQHIKWFMDVIDTRMKHDSLILIPEKATVKKGQMATSRW